MVSRALHDGGAQENAIRGWDGVFTGWPFSQVGLWTKEKTNF